MPNPVDFEKYVFINCPFDEDFLPLLHVLLFTVIKCGYKPRIATERSDSGEVRIKKIIELISESKFSIHDLSRMEPLNPGEMPRFNMPFELGIDLGCREYGNDNLREKRCLILEKELYRYRAAISDISGNDIRHHENDPRKLVKAVRNWFAEKGVFNLASPNRIWDSYNEFLPKLIDEVKKLGYEEDEYTEISVTELIYHISRLSPPLV